MATAVAHFKISYAEAARKALSYDMIFKFKENPNAPYLLFMSWVQSEEGKQFGENKPIRHIIRSANDPRAITCYCVGKRYVLWKDGSVSVDTPDQTVSCSDQELGMRHHGEDVHGRHEEEARRVRRQVLQGERR